ncbi:MmgE/PrpD family protein [Micromonospora cremea]|uniref:MmgE/PrpD family protein n=1 Tax=Micromonospora cremea TaxID=709881 RepID=UPI000A073655
MRSHESSSTSPRDLSTSICLTRWGEQLRCGRSTPWLRTRCGVEPDCPRGGGGRRPARDTGRRPDPGVASAGAPADAAFVNTVLIRYLDFNDWAPNLHPSDCLGGLLAFADEPGVDGRRLLTATVVAYEVLIGLTRAMRPRDIVATVRAPDPPWGRGDRCRGRPPPQRPATCRAPAGQVRRPCGSLGAGTGIGAGCRRGGLVGREPPGRSRPRARG